MRTRALIIKKQATNEYDQLITCYTREFGKLTAIAKSILKPSSMQSMHLDVLNMVEFELISGKGMPIISAAQVESTYPNIKSSRPALAVASFLMEVVDKMIFDQQPDDDLWTFFTTYFENLNQKPYPSLAFFRELQLSLLTTLGHAPSIGECLLCSVRQSSNWALSPELGGIICGNCFLAGHKGVLLKKADIDLFDGKKIVDTSTSSVLDTLFEHNANAKFNSIPFIYSHASVNSL